MPQRTVYIRKDDEDAWNACQDKAGLVRRALHSQNTTDLSTGNKVNTIAPFIKPEKDYDYCPHGAVKGFCKNGCK